jgi:nucleosome assembly protein 1-like 1
MPCDEEALKSLNKVDVEFLPDSDNYNVNFHFAPNEFFENNILTLKFFVDKNEDTEKIEATTINWKAGKCITEKVETKTQTNKKTKKKRTVEKKVQQESFFQLFKNRSADEEEEDEPEEDDSLNLEGIYDAGSIGDSFSLVKYFFTKYHGAAFYEAKIPEFDFGGEGFGDGDDEDGDEEEDDDDAGDDDDKPKRKKSDHKKKGGAAGKDGAKQEECKKQ